MMQAAVPKTTFGGGAAVPERSLAQALWRGMKCRCPNCGEGHIFRAYLKVSDHCEVCGEALHHHRADDAPPYFTIAIVGHVIIAALLAVEVAYAPPVWLHMAIWLPLTLLMSLVLLPPIKGALVNLQWALHMHGFHPNGPDDEIGETWPPKGTER